MFQSVVFLFLVIFFGSMQLVFYCRRLFSILNSTLFYILEQLCLFVLDICFFFLN